MKTVAVSQRVMPMKKPRERRDGLDRRWVSFLERCGFVPILIPNDVRTARKILKAARCQAVLLTGGNDLAPYGGDALERDATERYLLRHALKNKMPVLGVCRGMQMIQDFYGIKLRRFDGHVAAKQIIRVHNKKETVNSYHHFGSRVTLSPLETWAVALDGVVKAIRCPAKKLCGVMWHPERFRPFRKKDLRWVRKFFNGGG